MHKVQMYEGILDMLEREVSEIEKANSLDVQTLDHLYKLLMSIKCTDKCIEIRQSGGMSQGMSQGMSGRMSYGSYGSSYARRGRDGDGDGRYNEGRGSYRSSYQSNNSYGDSRESLIQKLEALKDEARNDHERRTIMECLEQL